MAVEQQIKRAMRNRKLINIVHQRPVSEGSDEMMPVTFRGLAPFNIGVSTAGNPVLRAYQMEGESHDSPNPGWALYRLDRMQVEATDTDFNEADPRFRQYNRGGDGGMRSVSAMVSQYPKPQTTTFARYSRGDWQPKSKRRRY